MRIKKIFLYVGLLLSCQSALSQIAPPGAVMASFDCSLADGVTMSEAITYARDHTRDGWGNVIGVFYREPIIGAGEFREDHDFRTVTYFPSWADWWEYYAGERSEARQIAIERRRSFYSCEDGSAIAVLAHPDGNNFSGPETLMTTRVCYRNEESSRDDVYQWMLELGDNYLEAGSNDALWLYNPVFTPNPANGPNRGIVIATVGESGSSLMDRIDLRRSGAVTGPSQPVFESCRLPNLWRSHRVYSASN
tara:strand:+ start:319 stop:1068 length:750 start_codon:yes stop_codon:yes gene_type:complete